jgi:hypothetical protein
MLARDGRGAVRLECRLDCQSGGSVDVSVGLVHPSASARHLFPLVLMKLQRVVLPSPVSAVHVEATITALLQRRQEEMFSDVPRRGHPRHLAGLIDRLSSRLGRRWVVRARLVDPGPVLDDLRRGRFALIIIRTNPADLPPLGAARDSYGGVWYGPMLDEMRAHYAVREMLYPYYLLAPLRLTPSSPRAPGRG